MSFYFAIPFVVLVLGAALLIGGECMKDNVGGAILRVVGMLVIVLSLVFIGGCIFIISSAKA